MKKRETIICMLSVWLLLSSVPSMAGTLLIDSVRVSGMFRSFSYYVPAHLAAHSSLIFVLHGSGGTPEGIEAGTGFQFDRLADTQAATIVVYPAGYHRFWNDCRKKATYDAKREQIDDVGFFEAMRTYFIQHYQIDTGSVFVAGHSNGGHMCYKLAKQKPEWFRGVAAISANLPTEESNDCYEAHLPVSMLIINGTADPVNPYNGGEVLAGDGNKRGNVVSADETIDYWVKNTGCKTLTPNISAIADKDTSDHSTAQRYDYSCTKTGKQVVFIKVINGGHDIPNRDSLIWQHQSNKVNKDFDAPEFIWRFFMGLK